MAVSLAYSRTFDRALAARNGAVIWAGSSDALAFVRPRVRAGWHNCLGLIDTDPKDADFSALFGIGVIVCLVDDSCGDPRDIAVALIRAGVTGVVVLDINGVVLDDDGNYLLADLTK